MWITTNNTISAEAYYVILHCPHYQRIGPAMQLYQHTTTPTSHTRPLPHSLLYVGYYSFTALLRIDLCTQSVSNLLKIACSWTTRGLCGMNPILFHSTTTRTSKEKWRLLGHLMENFIHGNIMPSNL